jgi:hypothetical protein
MSKKIKIILLSVLGVIILLGIIGWYTPQDDTKTPPITNGPTITRAERLADHDLLYAYMSSSGMCGNDRGERGGCYTEYYLYSSGKLDKEMGWFGENGTKSIFPTEERQVATTTVDQIKTTLKNSGILTLDCPAQEIMDADFDYFANIDGTKKEFHNPPKTCGTTLENIERTLREITEKQPAATTTSVQVAGNLGGKQCTSLFNVKRDLKENVDKELFDLDYFQSFGSGAFYGKIKNFKPEDNKKFSLFIDQLMKEQKIKTFEHMEANICSYYQDLLNPENGANLIYYIEHVYYTNSRNVGKYDLHVNLDADGNFVGYREGKTF